MTPLPKLVVEFNRAGDPIVAEFGPARYRRSKKARIATFHHDGLIRSRDDAVANAELFVKASRLAADNERLRTLNDGLTKACLKAEAVLSQLQDAMPLEGDAQDIMAQGYVGHAICSLRAAISRAGEAVQ